MGTENGPVRLSETALDPAPGHPVSSASAGAYPAAPAHVPDARQLATCSGQLLLRPFYSGGSFCP